MCKLLRHYLQNDDSYPCPKCNNIVDRDVLVFALYNSSSYEVTPVSPDSSRARIHIHNCDKIVQRQLAQGGVVN
jgi:hypothetical protein